MMMMMNDEANGRTASSSVVSGNKMGKQNGLLCFCQIQYVLNSDSRAILCTVESRVNECVSYARVRTNRLFTVGYCSFFTSSGGHKDQCQ